MSDVEKLWELQTVLSQLADREKQMSVKPESFAAVDREFQAASAQKETLDQQYEQLSKEKRRVEGELGDQQEQLKKYQGTLMQVKNQQQYAAAWKEIDTTRKQVKELEDSDLKVMGDMETIDNQRNELSAGYDDLKKRYDTAHDDWQSSIGDLRSESEQLRKKLEEIKRGIPARLVSEFDKIARQRGGIAVAAVSNDACSGCRTRVRPAVMQQLKRGDVVFCENCRRILYLERPAS